MSSGSPGKEPRAFCSQALITRPAAWHLGRLAEIAEACRRHRLWLISDEIYHGLEYEAEAETALAHSDEAIVVNSFSKYFSMTGWRSAGSLSPRRWSGRSSSSARTSTSRRPRSRRWLRSAHSMG